MAVSTWGVDLKNNKQLGDLEKRIAFLNQKHEARTFNFACSSGKEGVSTVIVNLVEYLVSKKTKKDILVVDANFQNPVLHNAFGQILGDGLTQLIVDSSPWSEVIALIDGFHFVSCGRMYEKQAGNMEKEVLASILGKIQGNYDYIFIDSTPILQSADSMASAAAADATFLVIQSHRTSKEVAEKSITMLQENECQIRGVILNRIRQVIPGWMYKLL